MPGIRAMQIHVLGAIVLSGAVAACQTTKPSRGPWFAQDYSCAGCHAIKRGRASPDPDAPPFVAIVNQEGVTADTLAWLMGDFNAHDNRLRVPPPQLDELVAYMLTLQDPKYRPRS
jgi:hypothetical protein